MGGFLNLNRLRFSIGGNDLLIQNQPSMIRLPWRYWIDDWSLTTIFVFVFFL